MKRKNGETALLFYNRVVILSFDIEKDVNDGFFIPAKYGSEGALLLGEWRLKAAKKLYDRQMIGKFVIVGGHNKKYDKARPEAIKEMLIKRGIPEAIMEALESGPNTQSKTILMKNYFNETGINPCSCAFLTNFYHIPRSAYFFTEQGLLLRPLVAEAFCLDEVEAILRDYGCYGSEFSRRFLAELRGLYHLACGNYNSLSK